MKTDQLRDCYLEFFKNKKHKLIPSDSLVPVDPSVMFTSAGMNQFKAYFMGEKTDMSRATTCQKCLRTGDLENVGVTAFHHTFFEMLGNFSFGDYFKQEAIEWAWEFLTKALNMKTDDLWVSVYEQDSEAYDIWHKHIGMPQNRIVRLGAHFNFWPADAPELGPNGPCGPCSEIFFDKGKNIGCGSPDCNPDCDCDRFVEVWNLVFTQFNRIGKNELEKLGQKNIDTGMGLERMASVLQGKMNNFEIDILAPIVEHVRKDLKTELTDLKNKQFVHAIVDHCRAASFSISDGVFPSNEDRGYVVRRLIRKAAYHACSLGRKKPFLYSLVPLYAEMMKKPYPELWDKKEDISAVIKAEEEKFLSALDTGKSQMVMLLEQAGKENRTELKGDEVFKLYDTFGLPPDTIKDIAQEADFTVDEEGFRQLLEQRKEQSRSSSMFDSEIFAKNEISLEEKTEFKGYDTLSLDTEIVRVLEGKETVSSLDRGKNGMVVLSATPFYAESGGQKDDKGVIRTEKGLFAVDHVYKVKDAFIHSGRVIEGNIAQGKACAEVDRDRRKALTRAHTATHLLQSALRSLLGTHVAQQGSLVDVDRLRFDFTHFSGLSREELAEVEKLVNSYILRSDPIGKRVLPYDEAKKEKALAFFEEKYSDFVRVISVADYSKEFCGGTHADNTAEIGSFCILSEYSVSSGIRRIEAAVGKEAYRNFAYFKNITAQAGEILKAGEDRIIERIGALQKELRIAREKADQLQKNMLAAKAEKDVESKIEDIEGVKVLVLGLKDKQFPDLLHLADVLRGKIGSGLVLLLAENKDSRIFVFAATRDMEQKKITCKDFVSACRQDLDLRGGGRPLLCQGVVAATDDIDKYKDRLLKSVKEYLQKCAS